MRLPRLLLTALALATCMAAPSARAQAAAQPRQLRIVVPFGAGSGSDLLARVVADKLAEQLNSPVIVENREGAGGVIGTQAVARSAPDGSTLVLVSNAVAIAPHLYSTPPFDPVKDFVPVGKVATVPLVVVSSMNAPYKTLPEMLAWIKANPSKASYATSGKGSQSHLEAAQLLRASGLSVPDVPYKATGQALTDTIAGQVSFYVAGVGPTMPQVKSGKLRLLAFGAASRSPAAPDAPTVAEALAKPQYELSSWFGFLAPAGTPSDVVNRLYEQIARAAQTPQVREKIAGISAEVNLVPPQAFAAQLGAESRKWSALVKALDIKTD